MDLDGVLSRVEKLPSGCWRWNGAHSGRFVSQEGKSVSVYRCLYSHFIDEIPGGKHLHHRCWNNWCVNPDHLEPLDPGVHSRRRRPDDEQWRAANLYGYESLTEQEKELLRALTKGETLKAFAERNHYSEGWAKGLSREIRHKLGANGIKEAVRMTDVTAEDVAALRKELAELKEAQARLESAKTPAARADAREDVQDAKDDLDAELRRRGLSRSDLDQLQEEKEYERFKGREERLRTEREEEERRRVQAEKDAVEPPPAPTRTPKSGKPVEEKPESSHFSERPLWGRGRGEAA